jgi:hypothetical protein
VPANFEVGDLLQMKPATLAFRSLPADASLVMVADKVEDSSTFFYGIVCGTGEKHLFSYDSFFLLSKADGEKNF